MSLKMLAERLKAQIWRPIGTDWFEEGYFAVAQPYGNHPDTIKQFLSTLPYEKLPFYNNKEAKEYQIHGQYLINDDAHHSQDMAMTLELFKEVPMDIIIVTYPQHLESWLQLRDKYQPKAKLVFQVGNNGWSRYFTHVEHVLSSARHSEHLMALVPNYVEYHQEFPLDVFVPAVIDPEKLITSFVNCLPRPELYNTMRHSLPEYRFEAYGGSCPEGSLTGIKLVAAKMLSSKFGYHVKPGGDGYGHVLHNWFAVGRPLIIDVSQYQGHMGGDLLEPWINCLPIDEGLLKTYQIIRDMSVSRYEVMCDRAYDSFKTIVDFDREFEEKLAPFFNRVLN